MEARYNLRYTDDHLIEGYRRYQQGSLWRFVRYALLACWLLVLAGIAALCLHEHQPGPALVIALTGVASTQLGRLQEAVARRRFRKSPFCDEDLAFVFSNDGVRFSGQHQDGRFEWVIYTAAREFHDGMMLMQGPWVFTWLPDRGAADPESARSLRELVRTHVRKFRARS